MQGTKPGGGEQFLLLGRRADALTKGFLIFHDGRHHDPSPLMARFDARRRDVAVRQFERGDDTIGNHHQAQISQFELFELFLLLKLDNQFSIEQFEPTVSQSTVSSPSPPPSIAPGPRASRAGGRSRGGAPLDSAASCRGPRTPPYYYLYCYYYCYYHYYKSFVLLLLHSCYYCYCDNNMFVVVVILIIIIIIIIIDNTTNNNNTIIIMIIILLLLMMIMMMMMLLL